MADRSSWSHYATVTTNTAKISGTSTEIVGYLDLSELDATFFSNAKADGSDIVIVPSGETTDENKLPRELVGFSTSTNEGQLFFGPITVTSATSTSWDVWVGNASAAETNSTSVWSQYVAVYHLEEDPSGTAPQMSDSTVNEHDLTTRGSMSSGDSVTGKIGNSLDLDGDDDGLDADDTVIHPNTSFTFMVWVKTPDKSDNMMICGNGNNTNGWYFFYLSGEDIWRFNLGGFAGFRLDMPFSVYDITNNTWAHVCGRLDIDGSTNTVSFIMDGEEKATDTVSTTTTTPSNNLYAGYYGTADRLNWLGEIDEFRIYDGAMSDDQVATEYEQQNDPASFWTYGSTQSTGEPPTTPEQNALFFGGGA